MSFSYYEIYITCLRAFSAMGFPYGADEDAASMVTWLELNKLDGLKNLVKISNKINNKFNGNFKNTNIEFSKKIDLNFDSLLMKGPGLFDYFFQKFRKRKYIKIILKNCIDPIFILPLAVKIAKNGLYINYIWAQKNIIIELSISKNYVVINQKKDNLNINENEISLVMSKNPIKKNIKSKKNKVKIYIKDSQKRLEESISPNKKDWKIISNFAKLTFVPESRLSRNKGAGGGDDND